MCLSCAPANPVLGSLSSPLNSPTPVPSWETSPSISNSQSQARISLLAEIGLDSIPSAICFDNGGGAWVICRSQVYHFDKAYQIDKKFSINYDFPSKAQVDPDGNLFINDKKGYIHELNPSGAEINRFDAQSSDISDVHFAILRNGDIFASHDFSEKTFLYHGKGDLLGDLQVPAKIDYFENDDRFIFALSVDLITKIDHAGNIISQYHLSDPISCGDIDEDGNIWAYSPSNKSVERFVGGVYTGGFKSSDGIERIIADFGKDIWTVNLQGIKLYDQSGNEKLSLDGGNSVFAVSPRGILFQGSVDEIGMSTLKISEVLAP